MYVYAYAHYNQSVRDTKEREGGGQREGGERESEGQREKERERERETQQEREKERVIECGMCV